MLMAKALFPFLDTPLATRIWRILTAIMAGAGGSIILVYFLSGLVSMDTMASQLYWIMGFNTALTGYMLMEKSSGTIRYWRWRCAGAGLINSVASVAAVNHIYRLTLDFPLVDMTEAGILMTLGAICGASGGWLAKKHMELKHQPNR